MAWTFISAALDFCQRLGYHRFRPAKEKEQPLRAAQERLFWTVYELEKGLSLRLGRSSNINDAEITLPFDPDGPRPTRLGRIQGRVYNQLYSPAGLSLSDDERGRMAETLAGELRELINETRVEVFVCLHCLHLTQVSLTGDRRAPLTNPTTSKQIKCGSSICSATSSASPHYLL